MSTNETSIDKAFYSSEHSSTSDRPYVVVNYNVNTGGLNYTSKTVDEGSTFQLTWSGVSSGITWTSSNTSVATVNSSGKVTGVKAGTATITASASGYTSVSCTVTVTLPYGIYYVNASSGISIGTGGTQTNLTPILTYAQTTSGTSKYYQLWEIKHISSGKYSIRSIGNGSHLLYRSDSSAVVYNSNPSQTVPTQALWKIEYTSRGYKLLNNGSSSYALTVNGSDTGTGQFVNTATYSSTSAQAHWQLQILNGVVLLDADTRTVLPENFEKAIELGDDKNQGQLGIAAIRTGNGAGSIGITWSSSNTSVATVSSTTGYITTEDYGETIITASITISGTVYSQHYTLYVIRKTIHVNPIYDGAYVRRYSTNINANNRVVSLMDQLQEYYYDYFNVQIVYSDPTSFTSYADSCSTEPDAKCNCSTVCTDSIINELTGEKFLQSVHHTNSSNILYHLSPTTQINTYTVGYIGRNACQQGPHGEFDGIWGLCLPTDNNTIIHDHRSYTRELHTTIHEFGHFFGAPDHYSTGKNSTEELNDGNTGAQFSNECIYGKDKDELTSIIICDGCMARILESINNLS